MELSDWTTGNVSVTILAFGIFTSVVSCLTCVVLLKMSQRILGYTRSMPTRLRRVHAMVPDDVPVAQIALATPV